MVADACVNLPCELQSQGAARWVSCMTLYGCTMGGGVIWMVGTVDSWFMLVLGSGRWKR